MIEQCVNANSLSCLLNADYRAEQIPEPFRMQSSVSFRVTYSEYYNYILSLRDDSPVMLMCDRRYLKSLAMGQSSRLYNCYLQDMAFAICKELAYAEAYGKDATVILPTSFNGKDVLLSDCISYYELCEVEESELFLVVNNTGFMLKSIRRAHNQKLWKLAVFLFTMSKSQNIAEEVNLVYN